MKETGRRSLGKTSNGTSGTACGVSFSIPPKGQGGKQNPPPRASQTPVIKLGTHRSPGHGEPWGSAQDGEGS